MSGLDLDWVQITRYRASAQLNTHMKLRELFEASQDQQTIEHLARLAAQAIEQARDSLDDTRIVDQQVPQSVGTIRSLTKLGQSANPLYAFLLTVPVTVEDLAPNQGAWNGVRLAVDYELASGIGRGDLASVVAHELQHAADDYKSKGRYNSGRQSTGPTVSQPIEINARFTQALAYIRNKYVRAGRLSVKPMVAINDAFEQFKLNAAYPTRMANPRYQRLVSRAIAYLQHLKTRAPLDQFDSNA